MVCYCCVKDCKNNSNKVRKNASGVSFHAFPSNPELRIKWLRAIGRPNWDPPNHVRICSVHFSNDKVNQDGYRTRIKEDACPVKALPLNSNFEASYLDVCRICLATDTKMFSLDDEMLKIRFESIAGFNEKCKIEGLPLFICYICKANLMKCYNLIEKSMITQAALLDIFAENGQITKNLVRKHNRKINSKYSLCCHFVTPSKVFEYTYNDEKSISNLITTYHSVDSMISENNQIKQNEDNGKIQSTLKKNIKYETEELLPATDNSSFAAMSTKTHNSKYNDQDDIVHNFRNVEENNDFDDDCDSLSINNSPVGDDAAPSINYENNCDLDQPEGTINKISKRKCLARFTPDEISMEKYFDIVKLTVHEQIDEWKKVTEKSNLSSKTVFRCEVCARCYANENTLRNHISCHDPSRGVSECPVCKQRFKNEVLMLSHANRMHGKKFYCKSCPKTFNNVSVAKKHERWHAGHLYKCTLCPFTSVHSSALGVHARTQHARFHACARCGHAFVSTKGLKLHFATAHRDEQDNEVSENAYHCQECDISFVSEGARRVHILTSKQHKEKSDDISIQIDPTLKSTCKWCGVLFPTVGEMTAHARAEHRRPVKKTSWRLPGDSYPTKCEHCSTTVNSRKEHWRHVRQEHPGERGSYRAVITAVCDTCGKGFQNSSKLRVHALRHSQPQLACGECPRALHDRHALARHRAAHAPARPHACHRCPRAFKLKANLVRHARVHSGVTPYECNICGKKFKYSTSVSLHVRTVHYRLPHPPRKRRAKDKTAELDTQNL